ncbi:MAG TPA: fused MFS/spermidine synthase [Rhodocyclaceae bacterium]
MHTNLRLTLHYGLTIFLSAFLLFQVQPLIGKMILPWFGGSASVWTTCMLFFQLLLLLGYLYSHWVVRFLSARGQSLLHIALLGASLLLLPIGLPADWKPTGAENPTLRILGVLAASIGLPYFVLSTTGPLIQAWFARERPGALPYRLFALSNFGSLLALLAYPALFEPLLPTRWQSWSWSALFACFALSCGLLAWRGRHGQAAHEAHRDAAPAPPAAAHFAWIMLAACPSIMLVADTGYLTENIAPIPLLWVVPLALYLLSFILCFERKGWYLRRVFLPLLVVALGLLAWLPTLSLSAMPILAAMAVNLAAFFVVCMVCHGELARRQPHPSHLTGYYLMVAVGGALGGVFVGFVAPYWFNSNYELSVGIVLTGIVATFAVVPGSVAAVRPRAMAWAGCLAFVAAIAWVRVDDHIETLQGALVTQRNFYGTLRVFESGEGETAYRTLLHGRIIHGRQFTAPDRLDRATTYYGPGTGVGRALLALRGRDGPLRVGVVGVGTGTLASYGRPGDAYRLYDIDPLVVDLAHSEFRFLSRSRAELHTVIGDARLMLEKESPQGFDLLAIDAFSGDSVPIHLLTREAFADYFRHLKPDGVLAVHCTNRFLGLVPVVAAAAESFGRHARLVSYDGDPDMSFPSDWVLVTTDERFFDDAQLKGRAARIAVPPGFRLWRDDYSSVFAVLK